MAEDTRVSDLKNSIESAISQLNTIINDFSVLNKVTPGHGIGQEGIESLRKNVGAVQDALRHTLKS